MSQIIGRKSGRTRTQTQARLAAWPRPGRGPQEAEALRQVVAKAPGDKRTREMVRKQEELGGGLRDTAISEDH